MAFSLEEVDVVEASEVDVEPSIRLQLGYDDNPDAFELGIPEGITVDVPLSVWAGVVANIREKRKNPETWLEAP